MKKILFPLFLLLCLTGYSQQTASPASAQKLTQADYDMMIKKAQSQKTGAFVLIVTGSGLAIGGLVMVGNNSEEYGGETYATDDDKVATGSIMFFGGILVGLGSIPLFISSHKNREAALLGMRATSVKMPGQNGSMQVVPQTQLTLTIPLGR